VPHGQVREVWYNSKVTGSWRHALVYLLPEYDTHTKERQADDRRDGLRLCQARRPKSVRSDQFPIPEDEHSARSTECANVGKEIEMVQRDLERLHSSHGQASHSAMIAI
jgi:hypothetical protein